MTVGFGPRLLDTDLYRVEVTMAYARLSLHGVGKPNHGLRGSTQYDGLDTVS